MQLYQTLFNPKLPFPTLKRHDYLCMTKKVISLCRKEALVESDHLKVFKVQRDGRLTLVTCNDNVNNDNTNCCYSRQCFLRPEWSLGGILFQSHSTPIKHAIVRKSSFFTLVMQGALSSWEKSNPPMGKTSLLKSTGSFILSISLQWRSPKHFSCRQIVPIHYEKSSKRQSKYTKRFSV